MFAEHDVYLLLGERIQTSSLPLFRFPFDDYTLLRTVVILSADNLHCLLYRISFLKIFIFCIHFRENEHPIHESIDISLYFYGSILQIQFNSGSSASRFFTFRGPPNMQGTPASRTLRVLLLRHCLLKISFL